ncbi:MAG: AI-2E family transporter [Zetaproteobacteria bacterium CG_4_9_14_3_um_filter_49_83]|nr:MAG: permease [Zetaproteobacteria bacterium CG1_02_49_23]PIQ30853.1 MAG: permease [Zetaproteobacteria bacterium CG17_big_fil_post_rev_8_21_14_2_50_50_13]PIY56109.1 MAG: AI-2E family transporter [Zetaproteobacteria bacterium CG_4_10_14_0_8_um_filter_49_80]PJA34549.1 MAG: AI-2E family transporter [Zetaproteobacteria bacterium CG_4_9_14_3_um_filter_49_83]
MNPVRTWMMIRMADTPLMIFLGSLVVIFLMLMLIGDVLAPVLFAIALAYVLDGVVQLLVHCRLPRLLAVIVVCIGALLIVLFSLLAILPILVEQTIRVTSQFPQYMQSLREAVHQLQMDYVNWINPEHVQQLFASVASQVNVWGTAIVSYSLTSIPGLMALMVYAVLIPVMVFFLLKDKTSILAWGESFLPHDRSLLSRVWKELDMQIGNYIRGRFWESLLVGFSMFVVYAMMGHQYGLLLGVLTGISVWIPFVGAALVTIPVVILSFFQWGFTDTCMYAIMAYAVIQLIDANVVIPWLFSEVVNLHPVAIIVAVLFFGNVWGILGVFIAIPMAALVQSVLMIVAERKPKVAAPT